MWQKVVYFLFGNKSLIFFLYIIQKQHNKQNTDVIDLILHTQGK